MRRSGIPPTWRHRRRPFNQLVVFPFLDDDTFLITRIRSILRTVDSRWAIIKTVFPFISASKAFCIFTSFSGSAKAGFIQYHDRRVFQDRTRQRCASLRRKDKRPLHRSQHQVRPESFQECRRTAPVRRLRDLLLRGIRSGGTDVVADFFEQVDFLKNEGNLFHQFSGRDASHILPTQLRRLPARQRSAESSLAMVDLPPPDGPTSA